MKASCKLNDFPNWNLVLDPPSLDKVLKWVEETQLYWTVLILWTRFNLAWFWHWDGFGHPAGCPIPGQWQRKHVLISSGSVSNFLHHQTWNPSGIHVYSEGMVRQVAALGRLLDILPTPLTLDSYLYSLSKNLVTPHHWIRCPFILNGCSSCNSNSPVLNILNYLVFFYYKGTSLSLILQCWFYIFKFWVGHVHCAAALISYNSVTMFHCVYSMYVCPDKRNCGKQPASWLYMWFNEVLVSAINYQFAGTCAWTEKYHPK